MVMPKPTCNLCETVHPRCGVVTMEEAHAVRTGSGSLTAKISESDRTNYMQPLPTKSTMDVFTVNVKRSMLRSS
jgi:hypothetical protein